MSGTSAWKACASRSVAPRSAITELDTNCATAAVAHPVHHRADDVDGAGHGFGLGAPQQQLEHRFGGEPSRGGADLPQRLIELAGIGAADVVRQAAQDVEERADPDRAPGVSSVALLELLHQRA